MTLIGTALLHFPTFVHRNRFSYLPPALESNEPSQASFHTNMLLSSCRKQGWRQGGPLGFSNGVLSEAGPSSELNQGRKKLRVLIAGGGIGGLAFAFAAKKKGFDVLVFEKDMSAIRGEGRYRGPIQIQSNALAALESIDLQVAEEVMEAGCLTGDRINGLVDGLSGNWYIKFDTFTPAAEHGLPVTRVISRMSLQQILASAVGDDAIMNASNVVDFVDDGNKVTVNLKSRHRFEGDALAGADGNRLMVTAILENGQQFEGDVLVGADGIWSKVRQVLFGYSEASYAGYTCYTGIADFVPPDIHTVGAIGLMPSVESTYTFHNLHRSWILFGYIFGHPSVFPLRRYRVFLGHKHYFVSSDVGAGKMQWYAFHKEPPGGSDAPDGKKERLLQIFNGWCDSVIDLINETDEDAILRRDMYDRFPIFTWGKGNVTLLGDSAHAMLPNMGQGGCMAIEDSYQLAIELEKAWKESIENKKPMNIKSSLKRYEKKRRLRVAVIYGIARIAAFMASTYRPYLGVGLGPLSFLTKFKIPHPGRVGGRFVIKYTIPLMLSWVLGGISSKLEGRPLKCRLSDKASDQLQKWFKDDDALERALDGEWYLFPLVNGDLRPIQLFRNDKKICIFGSILRFDSEGTSIHLPFPQVDRTHACITCEDNIFHLTDLQSKHGTWITDNEGRRYRAPPNFPVRIHSSYAIEFGSDKKAVFRVKVVTASQKRPAANGG